MTISQTKACIRLQSLGLKQSDAHHILDTTSRWIKNNGKEWTVKRLKDLKQLYLSRLAGVPYKPAVWMKLNRKGKPKGAFKVLFHDSRSPKKMARTLNALMSYSELISREVTPQQWKKFHSSVTMPEDHSWIDKPVVPRSWNLRKENFKDITSMNFSNERSTFDGTRSVKEKDISRWFHWQSLYAPVRDILHTNIRILPADSTLRRMLWAEFRNSFCQPTHNCAGKIGLIQEPGYKLRAVANPNRIVQTLLEPYKQSLGNVLKDIPEDCTYDQGKAIPVIRSWLEKKIEVSSIDLSDATNAFPFSFTESVLRQLDKEGIYKDHLDLFKQASRDEWISPLGENLKWTKGQPLGLGPSFFAFALSHHSLMRTLCIKDYYILGDDVVIRSRDDANLYRDALSKLGCQISESKSFCSQQLAEFAGKIITPETVLSPIKWRHSSDVNFMDQIRNLGPQALGLLRTDQKKAVKLVAEIPEWMGGLGWNPKGKPLSVRIDENIQTIRALESSQVSPHEREDFTQEVRKYLLEEGLTLTNGLPHESYHEARDPNRVPRTDIYETILDRANVQKENMETRLNAGWKPSSTTSDPRRVPKALTLVRKPR